MLPTPKADYNVDPIESNPPLVLIVVKLTLFVGAIGSAFVASLGALGQHPSSKFDALGARKQSRPTSHSSMFEFSKIKKKKTKVSMQEKVEKEAHS